MAVPMKSRPNTRDHHDHASEHQRTPLPLPEPPADVATDKPAVEDLPQGKDAAAEAAKAKDD